VVRVRAVEGAAGAQQLALSGLVRCGVHRAADGAVFLEGAGIRGLAVIVAQVGGQGAGAGRSEGAGGQVLAGAAGHRCSSLVK
jgi:hypothetical protein